MKKLILLTLVVLVAGIAGACVKPETTPSPSPVKTAAGSPAKNAWEQQWETIVSKAQKEGELNIYTSLSGTAVRQVGEAFKNKYGISVSVFSAPGPGSLQKVLSEQRASLYIADVIMAGGTTLLFLYKPEGLLDKIDPMLILPEVTEARAWRTGSVPYFDKDHSGIGMLASFVRQVVRNTDLVKEGEVTSYKDLLKPRWKGKMVMYDPTISGAGNSFVSVLTEIYGIEDTKDFLRQLVKQELTITRDHRQLVEWVSRGRHELGLGTQGEQLSEFLKLGAPIFPVRMAEGGMVTAMTGGIAAVNKRPNPNATAAFLNWILSKEGHAVFVSTTGLPGARVDSPTEGIPSIFFPEAGEKFFTATEETFNLQNEMLKVAADIFGASMK